MIAASRTPVQVSWRLPNREIVLGSAPDAMPLFMGIVNVTPDSFSDGGQFTETTTAVDHALRLVDEGADIIDIGGESTRPGSEPVSAETEIARVIPVIAALRPRTPALISIDTSKAAVARAAIAAGADIINDVTAFGGDAAMIDVVAASNAGVVLMHMRGTPKTMNLAPSYADVTREVREFLAERLAWCESRGVAREQVVIDPGIGFGKTVEHNLKLIRDGGELASLGRPVLIGPSRKNFVGVISGRPIHERLPSTIGACVAAWQHGAHILRVHDVAAVRDAIAMIHTVGTV